VGAGTPGGFQFSAKVSTLTSPVSPHIPSFHIAPSGRQVRAPIILSKNSLLGLNYENLKKCEKAAEWLLFIRGSGNRICLFFMDAMGDNGKNIAAVLHRAELAAP